MKATATDAEPSVAVRCAIGNFLMKHVSHKNVQRYNGPFRRVRTKGRKLRPSPQERRSKSGKLIRVNDEFLLVGVSMVFEATSP